MLIPIIGQIVSALNRIGQNTDASGSNTLFARLVQIAGYTSWSSKIINVANSATANTSVTALSITGKPGKISAIFVNGGGGTGSINITIDGTTYAYSATGSGWIAMNNTNNTSLNAYIPSGGMVYLNLQWNNSVTITTQNTTAGTGFINIQYES